MRLQIIMNDKKFSWKLALPIGLMLFSFFFGAGNLIFPPVLGQAAGTNLVAAAFGFCLSAVSLPVLGVLAMAKNNFKNPDDAGMPAGRYFAMAVIILCALSIGPFFAIPRTCATSLSVMTVGQASLPVSLAYSVVYFALTLWMVMKPSRILDACGKMMAPLLLAGLALLCVAVFASPMGTLGAPTGEYIATPLIKGVFEGYNTMDALCALLFGSTIITTIRNQGIEQDYVLQKYTVAAGAVAGIALTVIYAAFCYCGGQSVGVVGMMNNGAALISKITGFYFGNVGSFIVSAIFFLACITTSVGLVTSISTYFARISNGKVTYKQWVYGFVIFSTVVANFGLTNIIKYSVPVLVMVYPVIIVMIFLNMFPEVFKYDPFIFKGALWLTAVAAINDGLCCAGVKALEPMFSWLPYYGLGLGWVVPAVTGIVLGFAAKATLGAKK
ncbi:MAG: branched-chain amino acid transport system II carrier protein [Acidaminococcaceae bacterium]|nr:branched-chain amino acid transport system II carrier protein [Acidaminococcaceae bacterium]